MKALLLALCSLTACTPVHHRMTATRHMRQFEQPLLIPILYRGQEMYQNVANWKCLGQIVPKGVVVDGASVPRIFWTFMPPDGLHRRASLFHDWAYIHKGKLKDWTLTRAECDQCFYNLMVEDGVSTWRAGIAYDGVRIGGWSVWDRPEEPPIILPVSRSTMTASRFVKPRNFLSHIYQP